MKIVYTPIRVTFTKISSRAVITCFYLPMQLVTVSRRTDPMSKKCYEMSKMFMTCVGAGQERCFI